MLAVFHLTTLDHWHSEQMTTPHMFSDPTVEITFIIGKNH